MKNLIAGVCVALVLSFFGLLGYLAIAAPILPCDFGPCEPAAMTR